MKKEFSNGELSIVWRPAKCIHSGICVKTLPDVYDPGKKPWIQHENANTEQLVRQVAACPSGSLTSSLLQDENNGFFSENEEKKRYEQHNNSLEEPGYVNMFENLIELHVRPLKNVKNILDFGSGPYPVLKILLERKNYQVDIFDPFFLDIYHINYYCLDPDIQ